MARSDTYSLGPSSLEPQWFSERVGFSAGILFSAHARLYVFADRYQVDDLKRMVLQRLNEDIVDYPLHVLGTSYVTTLIDYVYDDENTADKDWPSIDQLRDLVSHYAACWIQVLKKEDDFNQLMEDRR